MANKTNFTIEPERETDDHNEFHLENCALNLISSLRSNRYCQSRPTKNLVIPERIMILLITNQAYVLRQQFKSAPLSDTVSVNGMPSYKSFLITNKLPCNAMAVLFISITFEFDWGKLS